MLTREKIEQSTSRSDELRADAGPLDGPAVVPKAPEFRAKPRELPAIRPVEPAKRPDAKATAEDPGPRPSRNRRVRWALFALLPIALAAAPTGMSPAARSCQPTMPMSGRKVGISTDVSGIVNDVDVHDNQHVLSGQILYRLDPRQFQIALDNAKANLAQTALTINAMKQDYKRMLSDAAAEQAQLDLDQINYSRASTLVRSGAASQATYDRANYTAAQQQEQTTVAPAAGGDAVGAACRQSRYRDDTASAIPASQGAGR